MTPCHAYPKGSTLSRVEFLMFCLSWTCISELVRYTFLGLFIRQQKENLCVEKKLSRRSMFDHYLVEDSPLSPVKSVKSSCLYAYSCWCWLRWHWLCVSCVIDCWYCRMDCMSVSFVHAVAHHVHLTGGIRINTSGQQCSCRLTGQFSSSEILLRFN